MYWEFAIQALMLIDGPGWALHLVDLASHSGLGPYLSGKTFYSSTLIYMFNEMAQGKIYWKPSIFPLNSGA